MTATATRTATFTITDARYVGAKVGADLRLLNIDLAVIRPALQMGNGWARCDAATESPVTSGRERRTPPRPNRPDRRIARLRHEGSGYVP